MKKVSILKKIKAGQKKPDGIFGSFMTRPVSHYVAYVALKLNLSPNFVSFLSFVFCAAGAMLLLYSRSASFMITAGVLWWMGAILDAADGDLARFQNCCNPFGGWFDSFLDRGKEFIIFCVFGFCQWEESSNSLFLLLGALSVFSNVMSGYVTDTKKLFNDGKRKPSLNVGKKYIFGMVDTRDFFVIVSLFALDMRIALWMYGTVFFVLVWGQIVLFCRRYGKTC